jgi:hypothetical protein
MSAHPSTCTSSPDQVSRISVDNHADDGGATQGPKTQPLDMEISFESCNKRPQLYLGGKVATRCIRSNRTSSELNQLVRLKFLVVSIRLDSFVVQI